MSGATCGLVEGRGSVQGDTPPRSVEDQMGTRRLLHGRYEVGEFIGFGSTAAVHRGRDLRTGRQVAIKVLHKSLASNPRLYSRFQREARQVAGLSHPAIVSIYDARHETVGDDPARMDVPFIVMELVSGRTLRDLLAGGRLPLAEAVGYQLGVLAALEVSHRAGVVHRDIKPANVMVTPEGAVKVVDFGIARASGDPDATLTSPGELLGTPSYLAPEQVLGEAADARSDLYSAGCLLYQLVTGRPPFVGDDPVSVAYQHVHEEPVQVSTTVPALDAVLGKALAKDRTERFQDARAFSDALLDATLGITLHAGHGAHVSADR